ncbi:unnamed protein product, partial [Mesorhabditis belari]|uniref:K Homology domain-containing protein n=1 Tax=Mesorhabditis belari TaxID=2138241 RepID=A0AAF3FI86_9BILA
MVVRQHFRMKRKTRGITVKREEYTFACCTTVVSRMPEDESKRPMKNVETNVLEMAARLAEVPRGKDASDLPGESPLARRRLHSGSPITKLRGHQTKKNSKIHPCLAPYEDLLPPFDVDPQNPDQLAKILLTSGAKAKLYLNHYLEEARLSGLLVGDSQLPSLEQSAEYFAKLCVAAEKAGEPKNLTLPSLTPEDAANALALLNAINLRRSPSRRVESIMAAGQDHPGAQASDVDGGTGSDIASLNGEDELISDEDTLFGLACCAGFPELARELIYLRGTTEFEGPHDCTPLMEACSAGRIEIVRVLLEHCADINAQSATSNTALIYAAAAGFLECIKLLIATGRCNLELRNENGHCALMEAASAGHLNVVEELVKSGALAVYMNTNSDFKESPLTLAAYKGHVQLVEYLLSISSGSNRDEELHTALMEACMDGHTEVAALLLKHGAPVNLLSESFESPLTLASCGGHTTLVKMLLDAGAHLEEPNDESYTPLMEASREGHTEVVKLLLEKGANVNAQTDETGETAMTLAACSGHTEVLALLEKSGGDLEIGANSPLMEASQEGHLETVKYILDYAKRKKLNPTEWKANLNTSLIVAAENGHCAIAQALVGHGAELNYEVDNRNALMRAAKQGYTDVVAYLLENGADANRKSSNSDTTPLVLASGSGHKDIVQLLLKHGANPGVIVKDGYTCVMDAAAHGHTDIVELLLDHEGAILTSNQPPTSTNVLSSGLPPPPSALPPANPAQHARARRQNKKTYPPVSSPTLGQPNLTGKPRIEPPEPARRAVLHQQILGTLALDAWKEGDTEANEPYVDLESIIGSGDNLPEMLANYFTAFNEITRRSNEGPDKEMLDNVLAQWVPYFRNLPPEAFRGRTPGGQLPGMQLSSTTTTSSFTTTDTASSAMTSFFHSAYENLKRNFSGAPVAKTGTSDKKEAPTPTPKKSDAQTIKEPATRTRTSAESTSPASSVAQIPKDPASILKAKAQVEEYLAHLTPKQQMELHESIFKCHPGEPAALKSNIANILIRHPFPRETLKNYVEYIEDLKTRTVRRTQSEGDAGKQSDQPVKVDADGAFFREALTKIKEHFINTPFSGKSTSKVDRSNQPCKLSVDMMTESNHDTPLSFACQNGQTSVVQNLLRRGANKEHRDKKGFTPLILAASGGHVAVCESLLNAGAELEAQSERTKDTALSLACSSGRKEAVEWLLKKGANKEHRNVSDYTPLSLAASGGYVDIVTMLLDSGAEINSRTGSKLGISPLMLAAMNGHKDATRILLERGSDINAQIETNRNTALTLACFQGRTEVVRLLLQYNANVEHRAKTGLTPLMEAANGGYTEVGDLLLDEGADPNTGPVPSSRDTALTIAADKGHDKFVEMLVLRHAQIDARNKKGCTALWLACNGGHLETIRILVENGADVDCADNRKVTPLMIAFRKGHLPAVKYMVQHVTQFPSDQDLDRYIGTITPTENELLTKCTECRGEIVCAKDKQSIEAAKAAEALLQMLEEEEEQLRTKKQAKQRKNEKKKAKKQAAKKVADDEKYESDAELKEEKDEENVGVISIKEAPVNDSLSSYTTADEALAPVVIPKPTPIEERVPIVLPSPKIRSPSPIAICTNVEMTNSAGSSVIERQKAKRAEKKETQRERRRHESGKHLANHGTMNSSTSPSQSQKSPVSNYIASVQNEEWVKANFKRNKGKMGVSSTRTLAQTSSGPIDSFFLDDAGVYAGWKDVELSRRRATIMSLSSSAIARVIGRGGSNINAIREATQASIEVEKQNPKKEQAERQITIRGTLETVKYAVQMINGLVVDQEASVNDIVRQVLRSGSVSTGSAASSEGIKGNTTGFQCVQDFKTSPKMTRAATASAAPAPTTNIWQQRMAARQKEEDARRVSTSPKGEHRIPMPKQEQVEDRTTFKPLVHTQIVSDSTRDSGGSSCLTTPSPPISPPLAEPIMNVPPFVAPNPSGVISRPIRPEQPSSASSSGISASSTILTAPSPNSTASIIGQPYHSSEPTTLASIIESPTLPTTTKASPLLPPTVDLHSINFASIFPSFPNETPKDNAFMPIINAPPTLINEERANTPSISGLPSSIADIWSSASTGGEPWNSKLLLNGFGSLSLGTPAQSHVQDWGTAAKNDPQLAFTQQGKQLGNILQPSDSRPGSNQTAVFANIGKDETAEGWSSPKKFMGNMVKSQNGIGSGYVRPASAAGGVSYNTVPNLTTQPPRPMVTAQSHSRTQTPLSDQHFYSLAAQLAASSQKPLGERAPHASVAQFNGGATTAMISQKTIPNVYQAAPHEFDALGQILQKTTFAGVHHQTVGAPINSQASDYQAILRNSNRTGSGYGFAGAPPPGFAPIRQENTPAVPTIRGFTQYNSSLPATTIPQTQPSVHPGFPLYNGQAGSTTTTWSKPTPNPINGTHWTNGWS